MHKTPLVSIIAINYNNGAWVLETLDSIAEQSYSNIELIIVDDCSTDNSPGLIKEWISHFNRPVKFIQHEINKGVCATSNTGFKAASGKYVSYLGTDDILLPEKIEKQVEILENTPGNVAAVYSDAYLIDKNSDRLYGWYIQKFHPELRKLPSGNLFNELIVANFLPAMTLLIRRDIFESIGYFDENLVNEDYDMWLRMSRKYEIVFSPYVSAKYRIHSQSMVHTVKKWNPSFIRTFAKHLDNSGAREILKKFAITAYYEKDKESLTLLNAIRKDLPEIRHILKLYHLPLPTFIGGRIIALLSR